jgi:hypothetical protein
VFNLIGATAMMKRGCTLPSNKSAITIHKGGVEIVFDIKISTNKGALLSCVFRIAVSVAGVQKFRRNSGFFPEFTRNSWSKNRKLQYCAYSARTIG